jgi:Spy/CpxP family protein refolding chaperone
MKKLGGVLAGLAAVLMLSLPVAAQGPAGPPQPFERGMERGFGPGMGPGPQFGPHMGFGMARHGAMGRPLISLMLSHQDELGLSAAQIESLENLRSDFMRDAIRRGADLRIAQLDLATLLRPDAGDAAKPVDMAKVESKIREIEKLRGDLRVARLRTLEAGKAQLSPEQHAKLTALLAQMRRGHGPHRGGPARPAAPRS